MDIWETIYLKAKEQYHPEEVSPKRPDSNQETDSISRQGTLWVRQQDALRRLYICLNSRVKICFHEIIECLLILDMHQLPGGVHGQDRDSCVYRGDI